MIIITGTGLEDISHLIAYPIITTNENLTLKSIVTAKIFYLLHGHKNIVLSPDLHK